VTSRDDSTKKQLDDIETAQIVMEGVRISAAALIERVFSSMLRVLAGEAKNNRNTQEVHLRVRVRSYSFLRL